MPGNLKVQDEDFDGPKSIMSWECISDKVGCALSDRGKRDIVFKKPNIKGGLLKLEKNKKEIQDFDKYIEQSLIVSKECFDIEMNI